MHVNDEDAEQDVDQLHRACRDGKLDEIRQLLDAGVSVEALNEFDSTPLQTAIQYNKCKATELLLDRGANIEARLEGKTPLLRAIEYAYSEDLVSLLLDRGASAHAVDENENLGYVALHHAASWGFLTIMGRLIDMGVSVDVRNNDGRTPLMILCLDQLGFYVT